MRSLFSVAASDKYRDHARISGRCRGRKVWKFRLLKTDVASTETIVGGMK